MMKYAEVNKKIITDSVDYSVKRITEIIKKFGPRESGDEHCFAAQEYLKKDLEKYADETHYEEYRMAPKAFLHFTKTISVAIIFTIILSAILKFGNIGPEFLPHLLVGAVTAVSLFITAMEFLLYKQFCDVFYKKITGRNLIATRKATEETKKRIIISGHIDTAYEWRHIYYGKGKLMAPIMGLSIGTGIASAVIALLSFIFAAAGVSNAFCDFIVNYGYYFHFFTIINMITLHLFVNFKVLSPGANDNLTGTMSAVSALKMLDDIGLRFKNTEVCCCITDGEEAGLRGCKQLAKDHYDDFVNSGVKTSILCVDTLTDLNYLNVYNRDMTGTVKHDQEFCQLVMDSAIEAGHNNLKFANVFFGSSDAAAFSQAGIGATCLAAMDPSPAEYYHNRRDNYDKLQPETIKTGYEIILSTIIKFADEK